MAVTCIHSLTLISQLPLAHSDAKRTTACPFHFDHGSQKKPCPTVQRQAVCFDISTSVCDIRESDVPQTMCPPLRDSVLAFLGRGMGSVPQSLSFESTGGGNTPSAGLRQKWRGETLVGKGFMASNSALASNWKY